MSPFRAALLGLFLAVLATMTGRVAGAPHSLIESRRVQSDFRPGQPDVTETPDHAATHHLIQIVALQPPDAGADRGLAARVGAAALEVGVLRTR